MGEATLIRLLLCLLLCALILLPIATPEGSAGFDDANFVVPHGNQGLEFGQVIDNNGQIRFTDEIAARMVAAGAKWVHINFRLGGFQNWVETDSFGYPALDLYDEVVATAERHGLRVVGLLSNEAWRGGLANWSSGSVEAGEGTGANGYLQEFVTEAAILLTTRFAGRIDHWEIWNEPNAAETYLYPSNFAWLLATAYSEIKAANVAPVHLISGGLSSKQDQNGVVTGQSTGADYLAATYAAGKIHAGWEDIRVTHGSFPLDAIGQHIYVDGFQQTDRETVRTALDLVRAAYVTGEGGDESKTTVVTEMGWASGNVSERVQADNLQLAFTEIVNTPYVQTASWFLMRDEPVAGLGFGLLRSDSSEKPAWRGYRVITIPEAPPVEPFGVLATGLAVKIQLEWHVNVAPDLAGYRVYRATEPAGQFDLLTPEPLTEPGFIDVSAPADVPLFYHIVAVDTGGNESGVSTTAGAARSELATLDPFTDTWSRTDAPVASTQVNRTWIWGNTPFTPIITERYDDAQDGFRQVQYYDKSRMELADPEADEDSIWRVTNGLLVWELMTGWLQAGDDTYVERVPAQVNVAGDPETGPTYATLSPLRWANATREDETIISRVDASGNVTKDPALAGHDVKAAHYVSETDHTVAEPFWDFMNSEGPVDQDGDIVEDTLFENLFYATGFPLTEAYWTDVEIAGIPMEVLVQCFQRRCLTYTPDNPQGWEVEAGNVGWHYYQWRYNVETESSE